MSSHRANPLRWSVDWNNLKPTQKFLMWFPIIGSQRRIYAELLGQLGERSPQDFQAWEKLGKEIEDAAKSITKILIDQLGWPKTAVFLPEDPGDIPFWDKTGDLAGVSAIAAVERYFAVDMPEDFWLTLPKITFGEAITKLVEAKKVGPVAGGNTA